MSATVKNPNPKGILMAITPPSSSLIEPDQRQMGLETDSELLEAYPDGD